jgi:hypothetical protein
MTYEEFKEMRGIIPSPLTATTETLPAETGVGVNVVDIHDIEPQQSAETPKGKENP